MFNFKYSKSPDGKGYDLNPRLVKQGTTTDAKMFKTGQVEINFKDSPHDPWSELEVVKMLGCTYTIGTSVLLRGKTLAEVDPNKFILYGQIFLLSIILCVWRKMYVFNLKNMRICNCLNRLIVTFSYAYKQGGIYLRNSMIFKRT
ncbi:acetoacetate decarboxylase family protein [Clostridium sp. YIM B02555]|uniref:acetoacetate decarboxylase family protein n=1 Tax=Clostridium sp. YIM B02555 TaxID=2911968 RepID=UPI001EEEC9E7